VGGLERIALVVVKELRLELIADVLAEFEVSRDFGIFPKLSLRGI